MNPSSDMHCIHSYTIVVILSDGPDPKLWKNELKEVDSILELHEQMIA